MKERISNMITEIFWWVLCLVLAGNISWVLIDRVMGDFGYGVLMKQMLQCQRLPFQYRDLFPAIARYFGLEDYPLAMFARGVAFASVVAYGVVCRLLLKAYGAKDTMILSWIWLLLLPFVYVLPISRYHFMSDLWAVVFFGLAVCLASRRRWQWWIIPLVALATWNRETIIFIVPYLWLREMFLDKRSFFRVTGLCLAILAAWASVKALLYVQYLNNPVAPGHGALAWSAFSFNIDLLTHGEKYPAVMYWFQVLGFAGGAWAIILLQNKTATDYACLLTAAIVVWFMLMFGAIHEVRVFQEILVLSLVSVTSKMLRATE